MFSIQANEKATREISISETHLATLQHYNLLTNLIPSHGIVTEDTLEKLRMNVRSLIETTDEPSELLTLCSEVLYHKDMKAFGLHQLINLFLHWDQHTQETTNQQ